MFRIVRNTDVIGYVHERVFEPCGQIFVSGIGSDLDHFGKIGRIEIVYVAYDFLCAFARRFETHIGCAANVAHDDFTAFEVGKFRFRKLVVKRKRESGKRAEYGAKK